jgi:hypothetical protein
LNFEENDSEFKGQNDSFRETESSSYLGQPIEMAFKADAGLGI